MDPWRAAACKVARHAPSRGGSVRKIPQAIHLFIHSLVLVVLVVVLVVLVRSSVFVVSVVMFVVVFFFHLSISMVSYMLLSTSQANFLGAPASRANPRCPPAFASTLTYLYL